VVAEGMWVKCGSIWSLMRTGFGWISEGRRPLGKLRCGWEDNIKICPKEIDWLRMRKVAGCFEYDDGPSDSIQRDGLIDQQ
jgi:hypothetical protein